jgi:prolyl-tRNA editing enzyme YbaK/EbsC (Cys-tRNA(Pro) deacylase)
VHAEGEVAETELSNSARTVQAALDALGLECQVVELPASTRTAVEAAQAVGTTVAQIVKSIVFKGSRSQEALLVLASGVNRVSEDRLADLAGEPVEKADADFVRAATGFVIGGVPPLAHRQPLRTWIDEDLLQFDEVWAAAGTPRAVFRCHPEDLIRMSAGQVAAIK